MNETTAGDLTNETETFGARLRRLMKSRDWDVFDLRSATGNRFQPDELSGWLDDDALPDVVSARYIARAIDVSLDYLVNGADHVTRGQHAILADALGYDASDYPFDRCIEEVTALRAGWLEAPPLGMRFGSPGPAADFPDGGGECWIAALINVPLDSPSLVETFNLEDFTPGDDDESVPVWAVIEKGGHPDVRGMVWRVRGSARDVLIAPMLVKAWIRLPCTEEPIAVVDSREEAIRGFLAFAERHGAPHAHATSNLIARYLGGEK